MSHESAVILPLSEPMMTPKAPTPKIPLPNWVSGKVTFNAAAVVLALGLAIPKAIDFLDSRYANKAATEQFQKEVLTELKEIKLWLARADSGRKCDKGRKEFCP
jgi:hypothetical protein